MLLIWNLYARAYDIINKNIPYLKLLQDVIEELGLGPGQKILDAGCGTGNLASRILENSSMLNIVCVDISPAMLEKAKKKFKINDNIEFQLLDIDNGLNFSENYFDRIVLVNSLYPLKYPKKVIRDLYRILKSNGRLVIADPHSKANLSKIFSAQRKELGIFKFTVSLLGNLPSLLMILAINILFLRRNTNYFSKSELQNILSSCDFKNIKFKLTYADQNLLVSAEK